MVINPENVADLQSENDELDLGAEIADAEANANIEETTPDSVVNLSDDDKAILAFCNEKNIGLATLKNFDSYVNAMRAHASRLNVQVTGEERDFSNESVDALQAFIADRKKIATKMGLHGHTEQTTQDAASSTQEPLMTPGQLINGGKK